MNKNKKRLARFFTLLFSLSLYLWEAPTLALAQDGLKLGTFKGLGAYEPAVSEDVSGASNILATLLSNTIGFLTIVSGLFFLIYFIVGGLKWLTAGGKHEQVEQAQSSMTNAAIGLIIVVAAYGIVFIIGSVLGVDILKIGEAIKKLGAGAKGAQ